MSGYTKLFGSILESTVWLESLATKVVWITLLAMADRDGIVEASIPGLAKRAGVDRVDCERALAVFLSPDRDSRTKDHEGRRITDVPGGWLLLNYETYRERASADNVREKAATRKRRQRERASQRASHESRHVPNVTESHDIAEAEAEAEREEPNADESSQELGAVPSVPVSLSSEPKTNGGIRNGRPKGRHALVDDAIADRAAAFIEWYAGEAYPKHRKGARYMRRDAKDFDPALTLVTTYPDDARLHQIAEVFLLTDHKFAVEGSRTIGQLAALAPWCDGKLREHGL